MSTTDTSLEASLHLVLNPGRGRKSAARQLAYDAAERTVCELVLELDSSLDFKLSSRGWCYILEDHGLLKGDFDKMQSRIVDWRKRGLLPLSICVEDQARAFRCVERLDNGTIEAELKWMNNRDRNEIRAYTPFSFWDDKDVFIQVVVEKIDLVGLFEPFCKKYRIPIANARGWGDIGIRADMMRRFRKWDDGRKLVLLYCGDHDPAGLRISDFLLSNMRDIEGAVGWDPSDVIIDRFGLNAEFIEREGLTWIDNLITSSGEDLNSPSHRDHKKAYVQDYIARFGVRKCEANSLVVRPDAGRQLFQDAIARWLPDADEPRGRI